MLKWLKRILGFGTVENTVNVVTEADRKKAESNIEALGPGKTKTKKAPTKKTSTKKKGSGKGCDFDKLTKSQLLKEAKHRGVAANASLNKAEILSRLKNAK